MIRAIYIDENEESYQIEAKEISPKTYEEIYKGNLLCEYDHCNAELLFNERQKGTFIRYFSTKPGSDHRHGCPNELNHKGSKGPKIRVSGGKQSVSDEHIRDVLKDAFRLYKSKLHPDNQIVQKKRSSKKSVVPKTDKDNHDSDISIVSEAYTNGSENVVVREKEPYIYKRETSDIASEDLDTFKEVHSLVEGIRILSDCAYIDLLSPDGNEWSLFFGTPFISSYEQEFYLLGHIKDYVDMKKQMKEEIICTSFGECKLMDNQAVVQLYSYKHFSLDNLMFYEIVRLMNKAG